MADSTTLMTIGEFSNLARLSVRMLRHYDTHGVLVPADVDPFTGYRRYASHQLRDAADIRNLRDLGFGVSAIAALLPARDTPAWRHALELQRDALSDELAAARGRLTLIDHLLDQGEPMSITLTRQAVPAMTVVALRGTVRTYSDEGQLWQRLWPLVQSAGLQPVGPCGVIEHDDEYTERDVDLEIFLPVAPGSTFDDGDARILELPARDCLVARVVGPYDQITHAHDLIAQRLTAEGLTTARGDGVETKGFNVYLTTPDEAAPADLVTDVCIPLA